MAGPWEKYGAPTAQAGGPWAKYAVQDVPESVAVTPAVPEPRQTATFQAPEPNKRAGYKSQVAQAFAASPTYGPQLAQPVPVPTEQEFRQGFKDFGRGRLEGIPSTGLGLPGDVMALANAGLGAAGLPQMPRLPNSTEVGNALFGDPTSNLQAFGRSQAIEGPAIAGALLKGGARALGAAAQYGLGGATGAGRPAIQEAVQAGRQGGKSAETFLNHMRGNVDADEAVRLAKDAVTEMRVERAAAYRAGIGSTIKGDPTVLDFAPIENAVNSAASIKTFKGRPLSGVAEKAKQRIGEVISEWKKLDPKEYHTPEGLDALKQELGDLIHEGDLSSVKPNSPAAIVVNNAYNAVKDQITKQAPKYAEVMGDYSKASDQIREIERTLSLGNKATADTGLRKLQSILRNNVNTNYGARAKAGEELAQRSPELMPALAGQALSSAVPRGIQGALAGSGAAVGIPAALTGAMNPAYLASLPLSSPRVVGEAAFAMGNARRVGSKLLNPLKNAVVPGGNAGVGSIDPRLLAQISPQMLNQLLLGTRAPAQ